MSERTLHLLVKGRVQGVGFRWFVVDAARRLGLAGWVKNRDDGAVEIAASGEADALEKIETAVREGPTGAQVTGVERASGPVEESLQRPFSISR